MGAYSPTQIPYGQASSRVRFGYEIKRQQKYNNKTAPPVTKLTDLWVADSPVPFSWAYTILSTILWSLHENEGTIRRMDR